MGICHIHKAVHKTLRHGYVAHIYEYIHVSLRMSPEIYLIVLFYNLFHQDFKLTALKLGFICGLVVIGKLKQHIASLILYLRGNLLFHGGSDCSLSRRILEYMHLIQIELRQISDSLCKFFLSLTREAHYHIRGERRGLIRLSQHVTFFKVLLASVLSVHSLEH